MASRSAAGTEIMPELRLVPVDAIAFHEQPETARTHRLMERIRVDTYLRNPPIVADMGDAGHLLLDGANRIGAFRELGYSHIPVQVVDYGDERIQLKGWHHVLLQGKSLDLHAIFSTMKDVVVSPIETHNLTGLLEFRQVYAILVDSDTTMWGLFPPNSSTISVHDRNAVLHDVVNAYEGRSDLERIKLVDFSLIPDVIKAVEHQLVLFPLFSKEELLQLAAAGIMIPTGITRHLIPGRALGINLDLAFVTKLATDAEKLAHFQTFLDGLEMEGHIRFYEESVFIMNE